MECSRNNPYLFPIFCLFLLLLQILQLWIFTCNSHAFVQEIFCSIFPSELFIDYIHDKYTRWPQTIFQSNYISSPGLIVCLLQTDQHVYMQWKFMLSVIYCIFLKYYTVNKGHGLTLIAWDVWSNNEAQIVCVYIHTHTYTHC